MPLPLLVIPVLSALGVGSVGGYVAGSWFSNGWLKWVIILIIMVFLFSQAKKLGLVPK